MRGVFTSGAWFGGPTTAPAPLTSTALPFGLRVAVTGPPEVSSYRPSLLP